MRYSCGNANCETCKLANAAHAERDRIKGDDREWTCVRTAALRELLAACNELKACDQTRSIPMPIPDETWLRFRRALAPWNGEPPP